jgi:hypothetical protein
MSIKLVRPLAPASPDPIIAKHPIKEAALPRFAHLNELVGELNDIAHYDLDLTSTTVVNVTTTKGIIDITGMDSLSPDPDVAFGSPVFILIANPDVTFNTDQTYLQLTPYYNPAVFDNAIPYVLVSGMIANGVYTVIYNASPAAAGANQWEGLFYLYYEMKSLV